MSTDDNPSDPPNLNRIIENLQKARFFLNYAVGQLSKTHENLKSTLDHFALIRQEEEKRKDLKARTSKRSPHTSYYRRPTACCPPTPLADVAQQTEQTFLIVEKDGELLLMQVKVRPNRFKCVAE